MTRNLYNQGMHFSGDSLDAKGTAYICYLSGNFLTL